MNKYCRIVNLYSGSGGNATFIRVGDHSILIDAGKSARALCRALCDIGEGIKNVNAIFITHEHTDHVSALEVIAKKNAIPIHMTETSALRFDERTSPCLFSRLILHSPEFCERIGNMTVRSFCTPHDSRMSVGYRIEFELDGCQHAIGYATDIGYVSEEIRKNLLGCEAVVIESNHDVDMLMTGPYPRELKQRVASKRGHLSNCECAEFAAELAENGTRAFMLAHLSKENNEPCLASDEVGKMLEPYGATLAVAHPELPCELEICFGEEWLRAEREIYNPWNA